MKTYITVGKMQDDDNSNVSPIQGNVMEPTYAQTNDQMQDGFYNNAGLLDNIGNQLDATLTLDDVLSFINTAETQSSTVTGMDETCQENAWNDRISEYLSTNNSGIQTDILTSTQISSNDISQDELSCDNGLTNHNVKAACSASSTVNLDGVYKVTKDDSVASKTSALTKVRRKKSRRYVRKVNAVNVLTPSSIADIGIKANDLPTLAQNSVLKTLFEPKKNAGGVHSMQMGPQSHEQFEYTDVAIIVKAIMSTPEKRMHANDIYRYIAENFCSSIMEKKAWKNSLRRNLSTNNCFLKMGLDESGIGNYWAIHPNFEAYIRNGDFTPPQARMRATQNMKTVPDRSPSSMLLQESAAGYRTMTPSPVYNHPYSSVGLQQPTLSAGIHPAPIFSALRIDNGFSFPVAQYTTMPQYEYMHDRSNSGSNYTPTYNNSAQNDMMANLVMPRCGYMQERSNGGSNYTPTYNSAQKDTMANRVMP